MIVDHPPVSLVISTRNRPQLILDTVNSVLSGDEVPAEIIVIDQSDQTNSALAHYDCSGKCQLHYHWQRSKGVSKGRNYGFDTASQTILAVIDDDMYVAHDWLGCLIQGLVSAGENAIMTGKVLPCSTEASNGFVPSTIEDDQPAVYNGRVEKDVLYSGNMACYRSVFAKVGYFDEQMGPGTAFPAGEDIDLGYRLLEAGYQICYLPEATVYHRAWRSQNSYLILRWNYGVGRGAFYAKHISLRDPYILRKMGRDIFNHIIQFPYNLLQRRTQAIGGLVLAIGILFGATRWKVQNP
jgi:GT2 family glycosyltransferase